MNQNLLLILVLSLLSSPIFSQKVGDKFVISETTPMYSTPYKSKKYDIVVKGQKIEIIKEPNDSGYYVVRIENGYYRWSDSLYIKKMYELSELQKDQSGMNNNSGKKEDIISYYKRIYGKPDSESDYNSGIYITKTLTWNCANGKYRSVTFNRVKDYWVKESEYSSNCIR